MLKTLDFETFPIHSEIKIIMFLVFSIVLFAKDLRHCVNIEAKIGSFFRYAEISAMRKFSLGYLRRSLVLYKNIASFSFPCFLYMK